MIVGWCAVLALSLGAEVLGSPVPDNVLFGNGRPRIINGEEATQGEFPSQLSIQDGRFHFCGASIINAYFALTAAHCVQSISTVNVRLFAGSTNLKTGGSYHNIDHIIVHYKYKPSNSWINDIALIKVKNPFVIDGMHVKAVTLPPPGVSPAAGSRATVAGWGYISESGRLPDILQKVDIEIFPQNECQRIYNSIFYLIHPSQICGHFTDTEVGACSGDSGGPLFVDGVIVGVTSWVEQCATRRWPTVFTRVDNYVDWINEWAFRNRHF